MRLERWLGALHERNFRLYFIGELTSSVGTGMAPVALSFAVLALRHSSATTVGEVLTAETVPLVVFLLIAGVVADRLGRRKVMVGADALRGSAEALLAAWILLGHPPIWGFLLLAALVGTGTAFFQPALTGLIPEIVPGERLNQANALNGLTNSVGSIIGPALAGVIVATTSPGWAIFADALSYAVSVACLAALRLQPAARTGKESFYRQLREGWREFWSRVWLWTIVLEAAVGNMAMMAPFFVLGAVISKSYLGGATAWGAILGSLGVGSVLGGVFMLRFKFRRPLVAATVSLLVWPFPLLALAYHDPVPVISVGAFLGGASFSIFGTQWSSTLQRQVPRAVLSRVSAYDWFCSMVFLPLGFAIVGPVSSAIGVHAVFIIGSVTAVASGALAMCIPSIRHMGNEDAQHPEETAPPPESLGPPAVVDVIGLP
jgi:Transmembrane secretion effector